MKKNFHRTKDSLNPSTNMKKTSFLKVDTLLGDYRTGAAQDAETTSAITGALLLHLLASGRAVGRLPHRRRRTRRRRPSRALLAYGPGPGRVHNQPNHLGAGDVPLCRRPGHGDGLEHRSRAAQLLHQAAIGEQILGPTDVLPPAAAAAWSWPRTPRELAFC